MSKKEFKKLFKAAKEAINSDPKAALKLCRSALKKQDEGQCLQALVCLTSCSNSNSALQPLCDCWGCLCFGRHI